ncbi:15659_t:CDS:1 [Dentiscutata erythropus]|uniref:15659_t:CDS:1 n=1 Tax=Dentiscutata erythropus TaxID=1348616 RepID=A0A9N8YQR3_9GLOM|nr:15659_t:CDS:1 [Dentiscutata erythropus]
MCLPSTSQNLTSKPSISFVSCPVCFRNFKSENRYRQHCNAIKKYNVPHSDLDEIPVRTLHEFKNILIQQIHRQLPLSFTKIGRKALTVLCTESLFVAVFRGHVHQVSNNPRVYKCRFHGESAYSTLAQILEDPKWGQKNYDHNLQTYIVLELLNHTLYPNINNDQDNDIDPLVQLNNQKKKKKT